MAPKTIRNYGDKSEGARTTRIGRDKGETAGLSKRLASTTGKAVGKNTSGLLKDAKTSDNTTPPLEMNMKSKSQSTITAFLSESPKKQDNISLLTVWGKDNSDKFYSLTEESDLSSADRSLSESDESESYEAGNKSLNCEFTVRQIRQWRSAKPHSDSKECHENAASMSGRTLRWDYSGIGLADTPTVGN
ncbi:hypothetical protein NDU88_005413 [Pleurodeles waltl]|uniref:Uncharacterized protein n=1 Tax=Pleurodeles waltl TaxID=8319 RepID=A0AAV7M9X7_PLEWA|nr:hypothetical protein NDU88_005413 [Pleurodeles waltl]